MEERFDKPDVNSGNANAVDCESRSSENSNESDLSREKGAT